MFTTFKIIEKVDLKPHLQTALKTKGIHSVRIGEDIFSETVDFLSVSGEEIDLKTLDLSDSDLLEALLAVERHFACCEEAEREAEREAMEEALLGAMAEEECDNERWYRLHG